MSRIPRHFRSHFTLAQARSRARAAFREHIEALDVVLRSILNPRAPLVVEEAATIRQLVRYSAYRWHKYRAEIHKIALEAGCTVREVLEQKAPFQDLPDWADISQEVSRLAREAECVGLC